MKTILETIAGGISPTPWGFTYARKDYQNLYDEVPTGLIQIFLDPVQIDKQFNEYGGVESKTYNGSFMILLSSDLEKGDYNLRYTEEIEPLLSGALVTIENSLRCLGTVDVSLWRTIEAINVFDYNMDGIVVTYTVTEDFTFIADLDV